ncbi:unnamed protein product [Anisakis simplex]|uniref:Protein arginine N-methyltransferase 7 (inferred by orthology to a C. elegans protein) n=1 Tax=Anisakis simplex TaxID=6269 RepID=A0A0M3K1K8_ANISI|nr:unnamed protein product [Anisakis simplex]
MKPGDLDEQEDFQASESMKPGDLDEQEQRIFELIQKNETNEVISLFRNGKARISCLDANGMTPLDQACFKANQQLVEYLIKNGADPNTNQHTHGYSALMFAAISGQPESPEICRILLDAGAHAYKTNSINKTASEMAAFVGQHECVSVINNYIGMDEIERLVHPKGKDSEEIFPEEFCVLVHSITKTHQIHPVKIVFFVHDNELILNYRKKFLYIVDRLFERQLRCKESNEVMSLKLWLILFTLRETLKFVDSNANSGNSVAHLLHAYAKFLIKMEPNERIRPNLETLLRNAVRAFPYHQSLLFQTLVKAIAGTKFGDRPDAYFHVAGTLFGQRAAETCLFCAVCGVSHARKRCKACKLGYCSVECQKFDWPFHKRCCSAMAKILEEEEANRASSIQYIEDIPIGSEGEDTENASHVDSNEIKSDVAHLEDVDVSALSLNDQSKKLQKKNLLESRSFSQDGSSSATSALPHLVKTRSSFASLAKMSSVFIESLNPSTGEREWKVADEEYDLTQEIARSAFGDMLHDTERNQMFDKALQNIVNEVHKRGEKARVVDIGTGTGLLSLMAARAGAEHVTAIEVFKPMADCARKIIRNSQYSSRIDLISSRSTDLSKGDVSDKGNIIVAEVFDTELIGEGALRTFKEAHNTLVGDDCRVIPSSARVWIMPVQSEFLARFHRTPSKSFQTPFVDCPGAAAVFDLQISRVSSEQVDCLCDPFVAFSFNFEDASSIVYNESFVHQFKVKKLGKSRVDAILMWWDLDMDGTGEHILSMAPSWLNSKAQWRDHWMQAVYYPPKSIEVSFDQTVNLQCSHDEFSMWFTVEDTASINKVDAPVCSCGLHVLCSRNAIYRMNELDAQTSFSNAIMRECTGKSVLCINEGSFIGLLASKFANDVTVVEPNSHFRSALEAYCRLNDIDNVTLLDTDEEFMKPKGILYGMAVEFDDLWKIAAPVGCVEGFDLDQFDKICQKARSAVDAIVEPQPLWEYDSICTSECSTATHQACFMCSSNDEHSSPELLCPVIHCILILTRERAYNVYGITGKLFIFTGIRSQKCSCRKGTNAVTFWMDWMLNDYRMQSGLIEHCEPGQRPKWSVSHRQGVFFVPSQRLNETFTCINCELEFCSDDGSIQFSFSFK